MPRYGMVIDVTKCDGCYNCFIACKDEYCEQAKPGYSAAQPMTGQDWMKIIGKERGQFPKVKQDYIAVPCMQCENASCMSGTDGAVYKRDDGIVMHRPGEGRGPEGPRHQVPVPQDLLERRGERRVKNARSAPTSWTPAGKSPAAWRPARPALSSSVI